MSESTIIDFPGSSCCAKYHAPSKIITSYHSQTMTSHASNYSHFYLLLPIIISEHQTSSVFPRTRPHPGSQRPHYQSKVSLHLIYNYYLPSLSHPLLAGASVAKSVSFLYVWLLIKDTNNRFTMLPVAAAVIKLLPPVVVNGLIISLLSYL